MDDIVARARAVSQQIQGNFADREYPTEDMAAVRAAGLNALGIPTEHGGLGAPLRVMNQVYLELARANSSTAQVLQVHTNMSSIVAKLGTAEQRARCFARVRDDGSWLSNGGNEPGAHVADWKTRFSTAPGGYRLNGLKHFCTGHPGSDVMLVFALPDGVETVREGVTVAMVPMRQDGIVLHHDWDAMGQRETGSGSVSFHDVFVPAEDVLGKPGAVMAPPALGGPFSQSNFASIYIGIAEGAFDAAIEYVRTQTRPWPSSGVGRAGDDPYIQAHFGSLRARIDAARLLLDAAGAALEAAAEGRLSRGEASIATAKAKVMATDAVIEMTNKLFQVCGARATYRKFGLDRFWRDARTLTLHDPVDQKLKEIGRYHLLKEDPPVSYFS
jgi:alkylation response protein AidB-like acyl-CoA dehydrogenase